MKEKGREGRRKSYFQSLNVLELNRDIGLRERERKQEEKGPLKVREEKEKN